MAISYCDGVAPDTRADGPLVAAANTAYDGISAALNSSISRRVRRVWDLIRAANSFIEDRAPWKLHKAGDAAAVAAVLGDCLETLRIVALLASPVIPNGPRELWRRLGMAGRPEDERLPAAAAWGPLPGGYRLEKGAPLFPRKESE